MRDEGVTGQKQHAGSVTLVANSDDAKELIKLAVIRSSRLHGHKSHKDAPKVELSSDDMIQSGMRHTKEKAERNIAMLMAGVEKESRCECR